MTKRSDFQLKEVLKIYRQLDSGGVSYIERHPVKKNPDNENYLGEGRPLTTAVLKRLINYISIEDQGYKPMFDDILLDPHILSIEPNMNHRRIIWYDPAGPREMLFSKGAKLKDGEYNMPALLYVVADGGLNVYAMTTGKKRPEMKTKLYYAPLLNLYTNSGFCWGSVKTNDRPDAVDKEILFWMGNVWNTKFSHAGGASSTKTDLMKIYERIKTEAFPKKELMETEHTLGSLLKRIKQ